MSSRDTWFTTRPAAQPIQKLKHQLSCLRPIFSAAFIRIRAMYNGNTGSPAFCKMQQIPKVQQQQVLLLGVQPHPSSSRPSVSKTSAAGAQGQADQQHPAGPQVPVAPSTHISGFSFHGSGAGPTQQSLHIVVLQESAGCSSDTDMVPVSRSRSLNPETRAIQRLESDHPSMTGGGVPTSCLEHGSYVSKPRCVRLMGERQEERAVGLRMLQDCEARGIGRSRPDALQRARREDAD